jgi:hypothetical protein
MMCRENFSFHFSCSLGLKSLSSNRQGSTTKFETFCVKFINKDLNAITLLTGFILKAMSKNSVKTIVIQINLKYSKTKIQV